MIPEKNKVTKEKELKPIPWDLFLGKYLPGSIFPVKDVIEIDSPFFNVATPDILLNCDHPLCKGEQIFKYSGLKLPVNIGKRKDYFLEYTCCNCKITQKIIAVHLHISSLFGTNKAMKY